ncbi:hypothetical protein [Shewanella sp. FJAT-52076]|uniref:hypothetical protein n=1 Tax=Shewanella sp. FJAT-52076 TaxID=2864202 RepID=UPI001C659323|nr:hypothetical protein [Shewanella sp. FJAT-52076]QYJ76152.1 hypothetical protein K0H79_03965 [Shewanella sp. FJAT-52076]
MNQAVEILTKLGSNTAVSLDAMPAHIAAMFEAKDIEALKAELDVVPDIVCIFAPAEDQESKEDEEQEESPSKTEIAACA